MIIIRRAFRNAPCLSSARQYKATCAVTPAACAAAVQARRGGLGGCDVGPRPNPRFVQFPALLWHPPPSPRARADVVTHRSFARCAPCQCAARQPISAPCPAVPPQLNRAAYIAATAERKR